MAGLSRRSIMMQLYTSSFLFTRLSIYAYAYFLVVTWFVDNTENDIESLFLQVSLISSCALSLSINHSTFVCTRYNDPLTTSVAGNLKNIVMTGVGIYAFGDFVYHKINAMGIGISMAGAIWYATWSAMRVSLVSFLQWCSLPSLHVRTAKGLQAGFSCGASISHDLRKGLSMVMY